MPQWKIWDDIRTGVARTVMTVPTTTIHLCPLYTEISPLITPCLDQSFSPSAVVILADQERYETAVDLLRTFQRLGVPAELKQIDDLWNPHGLEQLLQQLVDTHQGHDLLLNLSSGMTPVAMAAARFFMNQGLPVYQVNPENDQLVWLSPPDRHPIDLAERMDLGAYFMAHGIDRVVSASRSVHHEAFVAAARAIANTCGRHQEALSQMNHLGTQADGQQFAVSLSRRGGLSIGLQRLLEILQQHRLARIEHGRLVFNSLEAKQFASGVWLEVHLLAEVERLKETTSRIRDLRQGVRLYKQTGERNDINNELDVCLLADNRLFMIECKSGSAVKVQDSIYKLDAVRSFIQDDASAGMVVVTKPVSLDIYRRAAEHDIRLCTARELPRLHELLAGWICRKQR